MNRFCYLFDLRPGSIDDYEREHAELWPGVAEVMRGAGITDFTLFRRGLTVIATGATSRPIPETFAVLNADPLNIAWSTHIRQLMIDPTDEHGELRFAPEIWQLP